MMDKHRRLEKLLKTVGELERFQRQELERLKIETGVIHRERDEYYQAANRTIDLLPGSRSLFRRVEAARIRLLALERKQAAVRKRLLRTKATQKAIGARLVLLKTAAERRENELSLDAYVTFEAADPVSRKYDQIASSAE
jgi:hypothetical protein